MVGEEGLVCWGGRENEGEGEVREGMERGFGLGDYREEKRV